MNQSSKRHELHSHMTSEASCQDVKAPAPGKRTLTEGAPIDGAVQLRASAATGGDQHISDWSMTEGMIHAMGLGSGPHLGGPLPVQRKASADADERAGGDASAVAQRGVAGASSELPYATQIQRSFGRHDVSGVRAQVGGPAAQSARELGAVAYATGDTLGFADAPDLHTAAHEAAHVIQQRGGVQLKGGLGQAGDAHEQHADAVADAVVAGRSAEGLLDRYGGGHGVAAVQCITDEELKLRGARMAELGKDAPESGMNLWQVKDPKTGACVFLLGTEHGLHLSQMKQHPQLIEFLRSTPFTHVYSETTGRFDDGNLSDVPLDVAQKLNEKVELETDLKQRFPQGQPESGRPRIEYLRAAQKVDLASSQSGNIDKAGLDDAYVALAMTGREKEHAAKRDVLETPQTRELAAAQNVKDLGIDINNQHGKYAETITKVSRAGNEDSGPDTYVRDGNQKAIFLEQAKELLEGRDIANAEERNRQWTERLGKEGGIKEGAVELWIVGAAHLPGLLLRFEDLKWPARHLGGK